MVFIGYDRYNVIVRGLRGTKLSFSKAVMFIIITWVYVTSAAVLPFFGWGAYALGESAH